jgi:uncharacterized membrane protein YhaH (DUF805 family)
VIVFGFIIAIIVAIGAGEHLIGGDLQQAQQMLSDWFSIPFILIFGLFMALIGFAGVNLTAKRIRDIGLPGWWTVLAVLILEFATTIIISQEVSSGLHILLTVALLLIPTDTFVMERD